MRLTIAAVLMSAVLVAYLSVDLDGIARWAVEQQREFQNGMASAIRALRSGDPGAYAALFAAAGAYGFVHAVGPGHGKYLIGGVGFGTSVPTARLLGVSVASSLAQSLWAIVLVYGGFALLEISAARMTEFAEEVLAPASYLAIGGVGLVLVWRGGRALARRKRQVHAHDHRRGHDDCGCHAHGPSPEEVAKLGSPRDTAALIASIAIRPCTGAIFLLVIAWQMDIQIAGAAAVIVMGLGTAGLTSLVALSSVVARGIVIASSGQATILPFMVSGLQVLAGASIVLISVMLFRAAI